jgi:hypothetical protein
VRMDLRWAADSVDRARMFAKELVDLQPDVILAHTTPATAALQRETRTNPDCIYGCFRPGRRWLRCRPAAPRRESYRFQVFCSRSRSAARVVINSQREIERIAADGAIR